MNVVRDTLIIAYIAITGGAVMSDLIADSYGTNTQNHEQARFHNCMMEDKSKNQLMSLSDKEFFELKEKCELREQRITLLVELDK